MFKRLFLIVLPVFASAVCADPPAGLVPGGAFIDMIRPIPVSGHLESNVWGGDNVKPREARNGIEDAQWSYWCASVIHGPDGKEHLFGSRWLEKSPKGHMAWPASRAYHAVADSPTGPFVFKEELGAGHNTVIYQAKDGTYVAYVIGKCYLAKSLDGPWTRSSLEFDSRGMRKVNRSNMTFTKREDGSILMVSRTGQVWVSQDGLKPFMMLTDQSAYPKVDGAEYLEDPALWRDEVQYHLIVNDWFHRKAYYLRSRDGLHWKHDPGKAYDPGVVRHPDGTTEGWHLLERPQVRQDEFGRATHLYLAAIDCPKREDLGGDNHSSKTVALPLTVGRRLTILNERQLTPDTKEIRLEIKAEAGFDPQKDIDVESLRFGLPEAVNFGKGCKPLKTENSGTSLIAVFSGDPEAWNGEDFAAKLLGRTAKGELLVGYAKLPGKTELEPMLLARAPQLMRRADGKVVASVLVENFGQVRSAAAPVHVVFKEKDAARSAAASATVPVVAPYGEAKLDVVLDGASVGPGTAGDIDVIINTDRTNAEHFRTGSVRWP